MSSYMIRDLPPGLIARAKQRARDLGEPLNAMLIRWLTAFADGKDQESARRRGAEAVNAAMTPEERRARAQAAAAARWQTHD